MAVAPADSTRCGTVRMASAMKALSLVLATICCSSWLVRAAVDDVLTNGTLSAEFAAVVEVTAGGVEAGGEYRRG